MGGTRAVPVAEQSLAMQRSVLTSARLEGRKARLFALRSVVQKGRDQRIYGETNHKNTKREFINWIDRQACVNLAAVVDLHKLHIPHEWFMLDVHIYYTE